MPVPVQVSPPTRNHKDEFWFAMLADLQSKGYTMLSETKPRVADEEIEIVCTVGSVAPLFFAESMPLTDALTQFLSQENIDRLVSIGALLYNQIGTPTVPLGSEGSPPVEPPVVPEKKPSAVPPAGTLGRETQK